MVPPIFETSYEFSITGGGRGRAPPSREPSQPYPNDCDRIAFLRFGRASHSEEPVMKPVVDFIQNNSDRYVEELREFCAIPSISTQAEHKPDIERCARLLADHMTNIGLENV